MKLTVRLSNTIVLLENYSNGKLVTSVVFMHGSMTCVPSLICSEFYRQSGSRCVVFRSVVPWSQFSVGFTASGKSVKHG